MVHRRAHPTTSVVAVPKTTAHLATSSKCHRSQVLLAVLGRHLHHLTCSNISSNRCHTCSSSSLGHLMALASRAMGERAAARWARGSICSSSRSSSHRCSRCIRRHFSTRFINSRSSSSSIPTLRSHTPLSSSSHSISSSGWWVDKSCRWRRMATRQMEGRLVVATFRLTSSSVSSSNHLSKTSTNNSTRGSIHWLSTTFAFTSQLSSRPTPPWTLTGRAWARLLRNRHCSTQIIVKKSCPSRFSHRLTCSRNSPLLVKHKCQEVLHNKISKI